MASSTEEIFIGRQPILDRNQQLVAYELLFRRSRQNSAEVGDGLAATATVISHVFNELGLDAALGPYLGFVNLDARMLMSEAIEILPRDRFVLELLETVEITPEIVGRCRELKNLGFKLALDDLVTIEERHRPLLELADIAKVDVMGMDNATLWKTTQALRQWPVRLLAEKVDTELQMKHCQDLGYELFQGYYFAKPAIVAGKKLSHSELALMQLMGMILADAETTAIEGVFKQEPGLSLNLIRLTNSAGTGVRQKITSLRHAITVLGRRQLQRWLQLLLYTNPAAEGKIASPLLQLAATRGRLMELLTESLTRRGRELQDHAFMTGIMSLMPALLHAPMNEVLGPLQIAPEVRDALEERTGTLGQLLVLVEKLEESDPVACHGLIGQLPGLSVESVNASLTQALAWANNIGRP